MGAGGVSFVDHTKYEYVWTLFFMILTQSSKVHYLSRATIILPHFTRTQVLMEVLVILLRELENASFVLVLILFFFYYQCYNDAAATKFILYVVAETLWNV